MKILFVTYLNFPIEIGGFQNQVNEIYQHLKQKQIDVSWYDIHSCNIDDYDIIHFFSANSSLLPIAIKAKSLGKKIIITPMTGSRHYSNIYLKLCILLSSVTNLYSDLKKSYRLLQLADYIAPLTAFEKKRLESVYNIKSEKQTIIPNGINNEFIENTSTHNIINIPYDKYIVIVGRIEKNKNQYNLIKVANKLKLNLIIIGEAGTNGKHYTELCQKISGPNIFFWGKETNKKTLKEIYKKATLTVIASYSEMLPLVIFESLSQNTPVLCTKYSGIYPTEITGVSYTKVSKNSLAKNIKKIIEQKKQIIYSTYNICPTWDRIAETYIKIYQKL